MNQDRSTPLESVVAEARSFARRNSDRPTTADLLTRLADRVEELERGLERIADLAPQIDLRIAPAQASGWGIERIARQALSTQPHQDKTP